MRIGDIKSTTYQMSRVRFPVFEGEGDDDGASGEGDGGDDGDGGIATGTPPPPVTPPVGGETAFSADQQNHINKMLAAEKKKHQRVVQKAVDEANALRSKAQLTASERADLDGRLELIQNEMRTKEQQAKRAADKAREKHKEIMDSLTAQRDTWQKRYTDSTIERSITDAAATNNAFSPKQIVAILGPNTQLVEVLDDEGQSTGQLAPKVKFRARDKEGKPVTLDLSPEDAVKRMKDEEEYLNLFRGEGAGGAGLRSQPGGKKPDLSNLAKDPAAYRRARKAGEVNFNQQK
jgi:hypothetical protein